MDRVRNEEMRRRSELALRASRADQRILRWCGHEGNRDHHGYRAWRAQKSVLSNRGLGIKAKKCLYEPVIVPTALYGAEAWGMRKLREVK